MKHSKKLTNIYHDGIGQNMPLTRKILLVNLNSIIARLIAYTMIWESSNRLSQSTLCTVFTVSQINSFKDRYVTKKFLKRKNIYNLKSEKKLFCLFTNLTLLFLLGFG